MFGKTLEEKIQIVENVARREQIVHRHPNLVRVAIALDDYGWEDAASHFLTLHVKERIREIFLTRIGLIG